MIAGLWFIGKEAMVTVGTHLAKMHPSSGFGAQILPRQQSRPLGS